VVAEPLGADEEMLVPLTDAGEIVLHAMTKLTTTPKSPSTRTSSPPCPAHT